MGVACKGGTNFHEPMARGIKCIEGEQTMRDADVVMITDGAADVNGIVEMLDGCSVGVRCFGIVIGASTERLDVFCSKTWGLEDLTVEAASRLFDAVV